MDIASQSYVPKPKDAEVSYSALHVMHGISIPKAARLRALSPDEWEQFTEEWTTSLTGRYFSVRRFAGAGDHGLDVVGFVTNQTFEGGWDNFQCKRYDAPLAPSDVWVEFGKLIYNCFIKTYTIPRKYYFAASRGVGTKLQRLLAIPDQLKTELRLNWSGHCKSSITATTDIDLSGKLADFYDSFDFSIFGSVSELEMIEGHAKTQFHAVRFGGGLAPRPAVPAPPLSVQPNESRYIAQLFSAYSDHLGKSVTKHDDLIEPNLREDFLRQRTRFYHAESLRNFAREQVPPNTFEDLQEELYHGVADTCGDTHKDGLERMHKTIDKSVSVAPTSNALSSVLKTQDKQGICHQLANEDRLIWVPGRGNASA